MRVKDSQSAFNTPDLKLVEVMRILVPNLGMNTDWMDIAELRVLKQLPDAATTVYSAMAVQNFKVSGSVEFDIQIPERTFTKAMLKK